QAMRLVLGGNRDAANAGIESVRQRKIDDARLAAEIDCRLGPLVGQLQKPAAAAARENERQGMPRQRLVCNGTHFIPPITQHKPAVRGSRSSLPGTECIVTARTASPKLSASGVAYGSVKLLLRLAVENAIADEADGAPRPGVIGAHAQPAVALRNHGAGLAVTDLKPDDIFRAADPPHHADQRLVCAETLGDAGIATVAIAQVVLPHGIRIGGIGLDQLVAARLREQLSDTSRDIGEIGRVGGCDTASRA